MTFYSSQSTVNEFAADYRGGQIYCKEIRRGENIMGSQAKRGLGKELKDEAAAKALREEGKRAK